MPNSGPEDLARDLKEFSLRLDTRIRQFKANGSFSDVHESLTKELRRRQAVLGRKVSEALGEGRNWDAIKAELTRDYKSLFDELLRWEQRVDAEAMKKANS